MMACSLPTASAGAKAVDLYTLLASAKHRVAPHEVTPEQRAEAKRFALKWAYGG